MAVLWQDTPPARARAAFEVLPKEFVDWNDLRVSVASDVAAVLKSRGVAGGKAPVLKRILGKGVENLYSLEFERLCEKSRQQLRTWFVGVEGIPHSTAAFILYNVYNYDRVLVDSEIARVIQRLGFVSETAMEEEIETALAEVVPGREAHFAYWALREHALKICTKKDFDCRTCPLRKECDTGTRRLAEEDAAARGPRKRRKRNQRGKRGRRRQRRRLRRRRRRRHQPRAATRAGRKPQRRDLRLELPSGLRVIGDLTVVDVVDVSGRSDSHLFSCILNHGHAGPPIRGK